MNAKQAMRKAKKLAEMEAAKQAKEQYEQAYPLFHLIRRLSELEWKDDVQAGNYLAEHWEAAKTELMQHKTENNGRRLDFEAVPIRIPDSEINSVEDLQMDFFNVMSEADAFLLNARRYKEMIPFFQDMLEIFSFENEHMKLNYDNFTSAIGEAYHLLGQKDRRDEYFASLLTERNDYVAAKYAALLLGDNDIEKADHLLQNYQDSSEMMMQERLNWLAELKNKVAGK